MCVLKQNNDWPTGQPDLHPTLQTGTKRFAVGSRVHCIATVSCLRLKCGLVFGLFLAYLVACIDHVSAVTTCNLSHAIHKAVDREATDLQSDLASTSAFAAGRHS